ncbi:serine/threonine-protein kinase [Nannocystaceae bacterium ST9]
MSQPQTELARVGRYSVLRRIGEGGMSIVYRAYDPELDRQIALKLLRPDDPDDREGSARLVREARAMAKISHPNVAQVYDAGIAGSSVYVAMELIEGPSLDRWTAEMPRPWTELVRMYLQAGRGLAAAHAAGLVHRDFKPDNVMVGADGRPRVLDFGLARPAPLDAEDVLLLDDDERLVADDEYAQLSGEGEDRLEPKRREPSAPSRSGEFDLQFDVTRTGLVSGTPAYMAPEQHRGEPGGAAADQFAFCVALWEALYRKRPYEGRNYFELSDAILNGRRSSVPRGTHVPGWLQHQLERGLAIEPRDRHPSVQSLLASIVFTFRVMHGPI